MAHYDYQGLRINKPFEFYEYKITALTSFLNLQRFVLLLEGEKNPRQYFMYLVFDITN